MERIAWNDLPRPLRLAIEARTGPVIIARTASAGLNSPLAAILTTTDGTVFAKGIPSRHRRVTSQEREAMVAPLVAEISPALLWHFDEAGWNVLGYEHVPGRHADYSPGSADLNAVIGLMTTLGEIKVLDAAPFKRAEDRWRSYVDDPETARLFGGPALIHSDWAPDNVLISPGRAWLIDWAWPTLGAAWIDPACWALRLIAAGHTAQEAERQAMQTGAFEAADPEHVNIFAAASARLWTEIALADDSAWIKAMDRAAQQWLRHRQTQTG